MRVALCVNPITADPQANLAGIMAMLEQAAGQGAELALFPEAALTGLANEDEPEHDLPLGQPIPGPLTAKLDACCRADRLWLGIGLLERAQEAAGDRLYDTAVLLDDQGEMRLKYRRINPGWHGSRADAHVYGEGSTLEVADSPWGRMLFLLCGDLFDDEVASRARRLRPDWLLFPFSRCFGDGSCDQSRWEREEQDEYAARAAGLVGTAGLLVNALAPSELSGGAFGGAWVVSASGKILVNLPLGQPGIMVFAVE